MQPRNTFTRAEKLHLQKDFKRAFKSGRKIVHPAIFIYIYPENGAEQYRRLGLVVSGKLGIAVERNRLKRRLREIFRLNKAKLTPSIDVVFVPRPGACKINYDALSSAVLGAFTKAGVLNL
jgi:ribonuclease P protein component